MACAFVAAKSMFLVTDQIYRRDELCAVDANFDHVAVAEFADGTTRERFRRNMADARAGRDTAESAIGEQRYVAAMRQGFERGIE